MNIVGLDCLIFGVDNVHACQEFLKDYGLVEKAKNDNFGRYEAQDGTAVEIYALDDSSLPKALESGSMLRQTVYGVADEATLRDLTEELGRDREVKQQNDGSIWTVDDMGFAIKFQISVRQKIDVSNEIVNSPGAELHRPVNSLGADLELPCVPRTLSHLVYFVPDLKKAEAFYSDRLGFRVVDRFSDMGPFMRPAGTNDHHTLFMIEAPAFMQGVEHFTFHMANPHELLLAGKRFQDKGYQSFWGPGRHLLGSNWFWYFNSPLNVHIEYDADMDLHNDDWVPREMVSSEDNTQLFNFKLTQNWRPSGDEA